MSGKFEIFTGRDNQYYFRLKASNGEIIGASEGYTTKQSAQNGIDSVKINCQDNDKFTIWQSGSDSQWYFNLKAGNGEIILQSEGYVSKQGVENGVASVQTNAPTAPVIDLT
jgi:uncharacterized protein YegP (UPF0339 family)